jgi:hypothetical protein
MNVIVPLAGPDFVRSDGTLKALVPFSGEPFLWHVLKSRPWAQTAHSYTFIMKDCFRTRRFASEFLSDWFPGSNSVFLSTYTQGAACSTLAGLACQKNQSLPLIVDLADLMYVTSLDIVNRLSSFPSCGALALSFHSSDSRYSYLRSDDHGRVLEAAEKRVISHHASAGTYIFRNTAIYLKAMAHAFSNEASQVFNGLFYVCPLINGVIDQGLSVKLERVRNVIDIKS